MGRVAGALQATMDWRPWLGWGDVVRKCYLLPLGRKIEDFGD